MCPVPVRGKKKLDRLPGAVDRLSARSILALDLDLHLMNGPTLLRGLPVGQTALGHLRRVQLRPAED